jgi:DeoR/GlpR family transcriptional regulator of sugar metabolism
VKPEFHPARPSLDDVAVKKAALRCARRCVVACDSSKIGKVGFARIGALSVAATLVTDGDLADTDRAWLTEAGLDLVIA